MRTRRRVWISTDLALCSSPQARVNDPAGCNITHSNGSLSENFTTRMFSASAWKLSVAMIAAHVADLAGIGSVVRGDNDITDPMRRRTLLAMPLAASSGAGKTPVLRLSIRVEPLFPGLPLANQIERVAEAGYQGFEFGDWRAADRKADHHTEESAETRVCLPGRKSRCKPERNGTLRSCRTLRIPNRNPSIAGSRKEIRNQGHGGAHRIQGSHLTRLQQHASILEGLKRACDIVAPHDVTMLLEVINTLAPVEPLYPKGNNHANYYLDRTAKLLSLFTKSPTLI